MIETLNGFFQTKRIWFVSNEWLIVGELRLIPAQQQSLRSTRFHIVHREAPLHAHSQPGTGFRMFSAHRSFDHTQEHTSLGTCTRSPRSQVDLCELVSP
mmetsp:Transcript_2039/g.7314  ORF Transcript_2039/g.7314 Transcript_2039/m.7314 type:complete len:99 (+) Transcript_2039:787-1083(+)